jgi:hypothetical protein
MEKKTKSLAILVVFCFCMSILPATFGSFWNTTSTNHGKTVVVTTKEVTSNLKQMQTSKLVNGLEGFGNYTNQISWGKDDKNISEKQNTTKYGGSVLMFGSLVFAGSNYLEKLNVGTTISATGAPSLLGTMNGNVGNIRYTGTITFPYKMMKDPWNGNISTSQMSSGSGLFKLYSGKTYLGQTKYTVTSKQTTSMSTYVENFLTKYQLGTTRSCTITTSFYRNTTNNNNNEIKVTSTGKSAGTDKINNKLVKYTGTITIGYKLDPKTKNFDFNSYKEVKKSSSKTLTSTTPVLEALLYKPWMNS